MNKNHSSLPRPTALAAAALLAIGGPAAAAPNELPRVVVSATRHAMALVDAPAAITVVDAEALAERGTDNLLQALRIEPGVAAFGRPTGGRKALSLRGMDPRHVLVLVDGQRISASDGLVGSSDFQLDWTGAVDIARIEVVRGPMSVLYGAEALGGVINVITTPLDGQLQARAFVEGRSGQGGGDGHRLAAALRGGFGPALDFGLALSDARRESTPGLADARITAVEGRQPREAALKLRWRAAPGHSIGVDSRHGDEQRWLDARERSGAKRYHQSLHHLVRDQHALQWQADWGVGRETLLRVYQNRLAVSNVKTQGVASLRPNTVTDRVVEGQASLPVGATHLWTTGFELRDERLDNAGLPGGRASATHGGVYLQDEARLTPAFSLTAGARADHASRFGTELSPRLYAVWKPAAGWVVKGGVGHGFKAPTLKQIEPGYREDEGPNTYVGQAGLKPETNDSVEATLAWDTTPAGASLTAYRNRVRHLIVPVLLSGTPASGVYQFRNIDAAVLQGLEAAAGWRGGGWTLQAQAGLLRAHDDHGAPLEKRARRSLGLRADWQQGRWRAGGDVTVQSGLRLASAVAGRPPQAVPTLTLVNLHASAALGHGLTLRAGIDNATNLRLAAKSPLFSYEELPRSLRVGLEARW
ncbi:outer membrane receptor for ferrienterochelin and colicins [Pelomonas aquatica]|uniref:Outer membrane receptor for ferrienterochelin and colicins n=1 Tax=Pelomonas aquatica TaxID=431058 RepID=A0ABU1ZFA9_9BURK|nr:TonB-dependent receptor [Pelomonas aquatica]MDR7299315.1 outer membrane receptor for ferrienterochelin and colicins [Pelomonas aquatica]